jgi:hypothetical protein
MLTLWLTLSLLQADPLEAALKKHEAAVQEAQKAYDEKRKKADDELIAVLKAQSKAATAKGDTARARRILDKLEELEATSGLNADSKEPKGLRAGLTVLEYSLTDAQLKAQKPLEKAPCAVTALGEPLGPSKQIPSLEKWENKTDRNAVARGFLKITAAGEYSFKTHNYFAQCQLVIGGKEVNKFKEDNVPSVIRLQPGFHAILCSAWGPGNGEATVVQWLLPGSREWAPIPPELLFSREDAR